MMNISVVGPGIIGRLYTDILSNRYDNVSLVGKSYHKELDKIKISGTYNSDGCKTVIPAEIGKSDIIIITTKAYDTKNAIQYVSDIITNDTIIVLLQNGIGNEDDIKNIVSNPVVLSTTCASGYNENGVIHITHMGPVQIASTCKKSLTKIEKIFRDADIDVDVYNDDIDSIVWTKGIVSCTINVLTAITNNRNIEVYQNKWLRDMVIQIIQEIVQVSDATGIRLNTENPVDYVLNIAKLTGMNKSTMLCDIENKKMTEIDYITGKILEIAKELSINMPVNSMMYGLVKSIEEHY